MSINKSPFTHNVSFKLALKYAIKKRTSWCAILRVQAPLSAVCAESRRLRGRVNRKFQLIRRKVRWERDAMNKADGARETRGKKGGAELTRFISQ